MKISIICNNPAHPVKVYLLAWIELHKKEHEIKLLCKKSELTGGDMLFLVSCNEILTAEDRSRYGISLVLHASDLPRGRGWSPHIWELASGAPYITLSLLEAQDEVDSGKIWKKVRIPVPPTALWNEINHLLFMAEVELMSFALAVADNIQPQEQPTDVTPTYYRLRTPQDSRLDPNKTIAEQFNLMRVCDPNRFPTFFEYQGQQFTLNLEKLNHE